MFVSGLKWFYIGRVTTITQKNFNTLIIIYINNNNNIKHIFRDTQVNL